MATTVDSTKKINTRTTNFSKTSYEDKMLDYNYIEKFAKKQKKQPN